jgi:hypothetical protein
VLRIVNVEFDKIVNRSKKDKQSVLLNVELRSIAAPIKTSSSTIYTFFNPHFSPYPPLDRWMGYRTRRQRTGAKVQGTQNIEIQKKQEYYASFRATKYAPLLL